MTRLLLPLLLLLATTGVHAASVTYGKSGEFPGFSAIQRGSGLSLHKDNYILPFTYSDRWHGDETEVIFQFSIKQRLFMNNLYAGYTQKSFWQAYNHDVSAPFRETNYNPEVFYRWLPGDDMLRRWHLDEWGFDAGIEHESNGLTVPGSRSYNRAYFAPFRSSSGGTSLWYIKAWYRFPESDKNDPLDPGGDDNPDLYKYYGWTEATYRHEFPSKRMVSATMRGNLSSGRGSLWVRASRPAGNGEFFWVVDLFTGYGESLIDYDREVTRIGLGLMFSR